MIFVVETDAELQTSDFLGVNVSRGTVMNLAQQDLRRPVIVEAMQQGWIRAIRATRRTVEPTASKVIGRSTAPINHTKAPPPPPPIHAIDPKALQAITKQLQTLQTSVEGLKKERSTEELLTLVNKQTLEVSKLISAFKSGAPSVNQVSPTPSGAVEVPDNYKPSLSDISASKADLAIKEKTGEGVGASVEKLRKLRSHRK